MPKPVKQPMTKREMQAFLEATFRERMQSLGRKGGQVSGARRMENLTPAKRRAIAKKAARARWAKRKAEAAGD